MLKKRIFIALLAALLLTGCGNAGSAETTAADTTAVLETVETEPEELLEIDVQDYGGHTVNILLAGNCLQFSPL